MQTSRVSVRDELRDPWGWLLAAFSGGLGWAVLSGAPSPTAVVAGAAIGTAVLGAKVVIGSATSAPKQLEAARPRDRLPEIPRASAQHSMVVRARRAVDRMRDLAGRPSDAWLRAEAMAVVAQSEPVLDSLTDLGGRVTVLDISIQDSDPRALAQEMSRLQAQLSSTSDPAVRADQERALAALDSQSESIARLLRLRDSLLAQMQASAVSMESMATRTAELVALGTASYENDEALRIVADMTTSLDSVRAGIDEARKVLRDL